MADAGDNGKFWALEEDEEVFDTTWADDLGEDPEDEHADTARGSDMWALVFDRARDDWEATKGLRKARVPRPVLDNDADNVIVRILYTGFCGSDRGIWFRDAFKTMIFDSLDAERRDRRVVGHELLGEVAEIGANVQGQFGFKVGDVVAAESHITCGQCAPCSRGDRHVCENEKIIGFSRDGCFAEYIKLPAHVLWRTDDTRIERIVGAIQEPFGNAVHACSTVPLEGKSVAVFGCGPIGLFSILVARALGAARIVGVEPSEENARLAERLGADKVIRFRPEAKSWKSSSEVVRQVREFGGDGIDVALEMAGYNSSVNNAIASVSPGRDVILFGIKSGDFTIENFSSLIVNGVSLHSVIGRRIWDTWETTRRLMESKDNGIHDSIYDVILERGRDTVVHIDDFEPNDFERRITSHPKVIIQWR